MEDVHVQSVATYEDLGSIYSYGYGAMRHAFEDFHDGGRTLDELHHAVTGIISAVEFRSAEIMAKQVIEDLDQEAAITGKPWHPVLVPPSAIYETPKDADGIARDQ